MNVNPQVQVDSTNLENDLSSFRADKCLTVLIVEHNGSKRGALKTLLDLYDVRVVEAINGEEAIDLTIRDRPDLVLINTTLPILDGFEATRLIRAIKAFDVTPIIFLSNQLERAARKRAFTVGGNAFHIEPLDLERLDAILENYLPT